MNIWCSVFKMNTVPCANQIVIGVRYFSEHYFYTQSLVGHDSSVGIATRYGLDGPGIECRWGPWGPPSLLRKGYRVSFPGVKRPGRGGDHPPSSSARVKERVELYLYSPSGSSWPVLGRTLPLRLDILQ
jgi:hypothetical protein